MSRSKVTPEQRIEAALSYLNGEGSYKFIADRYGIEQTRIKVWVRQYKANGPLAFKEQQHNTVYAPELKANAVLDYLAGNGWSYVKKKYKLNVTNFLCSERNLTCYFYCILLDVFKILFLIFIWRQISTVTVNAHGIVKCFDVFKNQFMCMCIIKDFKPVDPFSLQKCMESSARQKINLRTSSGKETSERYFRH